MAGTLAEAFEDYTANVLRDGSAWAAVQDVRVRRAFMAGALVAMTLQSKGVTREQLLAEIITFGRVIGTPAERATN